MLNNSEQKICDFSKFVKEFETKYKKRALANWEYITTQNLLSGLKSYIADYKYNKFIHKKENQENYTKLYGQPCIKSKPVLIRILEFIKELPLDIAYYKTSKILSTKTGKINSKTVSQYEVSRIIAIEKDTKLRKQAYEAKFKMGDSLKDDVINVIQKRNSYAHKRGLNSYFDLILKTKYKTDTDTFMDNLNKTYLALKPEIDKALKETDDKLKELFQVNKLEYYHYNLINNPSEYEILNKTVNKYGGVNLAKKFYSKMGFDIDKLINEKKIILCDNKNSTRTFQIAIMPGESSGIYTSPANNYFGLNTLCHELGHAMYNLGISKSLPINIRKSPSIAMNESIAMMMEDVLLNENVLSDIVPADVMNKIKENHKRTKLIRLSKLFALTEFEHDMYLNPKQDLAKLWQEKIKKYTGWDYPASNEWATNSQFIANPVYTHNYIKAMIISNYLYKHLKEELGTLTENKNTAKYLNENIFSKGASLSESELLKEITGNTVKEQSV